MTVFLDIFLELVKIYAPMIVGYTFVVIAIDLVKSAFRGD